MANSKYEYVRAFEQSDVLLPNTWIVVRIDGRGFKRFTSKYGFRKPNDDRGIGLMNAAAKEVMKELQDLIVGYGVSDEYSFVFHKDCTLFERRASKLTTTIVSIFTAYYVQLWSTYFPQTPLSTPLPSFDGRAVMYPSVGNLRDYLSWRQVDCHINNLYNTAFWAQIQQGGIDPVKAEEELMGTSAADKNEILFSRFGVNYNNEPEVYRKGSVTFRECELTALPSDTSSSVVLDTTEHSAASDLSSIPTPSTSQARPSYGDDQGVLPPAPLSKTAAEKDRKRRAKARIVVEHLDIIKDDFWTQRPWILTGRAGKPVTER
ncbi:hypothetical protein W97_08911 [Coniosporium apollinis CBS 100218]|uniref:tRNA(His) guanylyltransferase n=1 Tax=Coniosporium apollinis (strain CBS 100218) TaxID=1168221 RepID=R7Z6W4_CONA1|nr:uncharacterized protein W97_08911 [Coniosporium apollinis CBS 100218]EON69651.1 hypothetical protein W97_08911 [Coniosporium apollinis CBS 100218]